MTIFSTMQRSSNLLVVALLFFLCACQSSTPPQATSAPPAWPNPSDPSVTAYLGQCRSDYGLVQSRLENITSARASLKDARLLEQLNDIDIVLDNQINLAGLYANVHPDASMREAAELCEQQFVALVSDINLSRPLYERMAAVNTTRLTKIDRRFVEKTLLDFRRSGVDKDQATREKIKQLNDEIIRIGQEFDKNIRNGRKEFVLSSSADLRGLPPDYINNHQPDKDGKIVLTTAYPDYVPFMQYAQSDEARRQYYLIFRQQAYPDNKKILTELLQKRYELAQLLGYRNFADFITEDKMIRSAANAQSFIDRVAAIATPRATEEYQTLLARLKKINPTATRVEDWQKTYLEELIKQEHYQVNAREIREYFHYNNVRDGIFALTEAMFGVRIKPWKTDVWHPSVEAYSLWEGEKQLGNFYLDMHPRDGKYNHAAEFPIKNGISGKQFPTVALVCNFPGGEGASGLMEHEDVETFLHEFGHLLHNIFAGDQRWMYFSGVKTEWDFVEAPSQMLEEWVWDPTTLKTFARNARGQPIPDELIEKMIAARDFGRALWTKHQLFYAALSLGIYDQDPATLDLDKATAAIQQKYSPFGYVDNTYFYASFGHLNSYSAIYYTYMWSLVIAADMHAEFARHGLRDSQTAARYRAAVLNPGGARNAADMVEDFLGRPYSFDAFAEDLSVK